MSSTLSAAPDDAGLELDAGRLVCYDATPTDDLITRARGDQQRLESALLSSAQKTTQKLLNRVFDLPRDAEGTSAGEPVVKLPKPLPKSLLPRQRPVPKPKPETRWERFAKEKRASPLDRPVDSQSSKAWCMEP